MTFAAMDGRRSKQLQGGMKLSLVDIARSEVNGLLNLAGMFRGRDIDRSVRRIHKFELIDEWMRSNQAIFIHIPKAAGRSIQYSLQIPIHNVAHLAAEAYLQADPKFFGDAYKFAIVRNPWDRLVSAYHFTRDTRTQYNDLVKNTDLRSTPDFASFLRKLRGPLFRNRIMARMHFLPQTHFLCDSQGKMLVDRIGRLEEMPGTFDFLTKPLSKRFELETHNQGSHKDFREYYTANWQIELVGRMYAADCRTFGYGFDQSQSGGIVYNA